MFYNCDTENHVTTFSYSNVEAAVETLFMFPYPQIYYIKSYNLSEVVVFTFYTSQASETNFVHFLILDQDPEGIDRFVPNHLFYCTKQHVQVIIINVQQWGLITIHSIVVISLLNILKGRNDTKP